MTTPVYIALVCIAVAAEIVFAALFLKAQRPGISVKSLFYKMICATMFLTIGVLSFVYSGNRSEFAKLMLAGLALSWVGDLFMHIKSKIWTFAVGFSSFCLAHIVYLTAYFNVQKHYFPERSFFRAYEIVLVLLLETSVFLYYVFKKKMDPKSLGMIASAGYGIVLNSMLVKSVTLSVQIIQAGLSLSCIGGFCLSFGGLCFFMSDTSLAILMFNIPDKKNHKLKNHNIGTYFCAQTLLALSVLFVGNC